MRVNVAPPSVENAAPELPVIHTTRPALASLGSSGKRSTCARTLPIVENANGLEPVAKAAPGEIGTTFVGGPGWGLRTVGLTKVGAALPSPGVLRGRLMCWIGPPTPNCSGLSVTRRVRKPQ